MGRPVIGARVRLELDDPADANAGRLAPDEPGTDERPSGLERIREERPVDGRRWGRRRALGDQRPGAGKTALTPSGMSAPKTVRKAGMS